MADFDYKVSRNELIMLQSLPLDIKIAKTKLRIREWVNYWGLENVYISFSGGKDSTVLLTIARQEFPTIKAVFVDTGLEYPEIKEHVKRFDNVDIIRPKLSFKQTVEKYGYPVISKEQSRYIWDIRHSTENMKNLRLYGNKNGQYKLSKKYYYLLNAPFEINNKCCDVMKKSPSKIYEHKTGRHPIIGTMAGESSLRQINYRKFGCNAFESKRPASTPLGFWTEQDVLKYISEYHIQLADVYGDVVYEEGKYRTTGTNRTGCVFCLFGIQYDTGYNRIQKLQITHPKLHEYILDKMDYRTVMEYMNIPHSIPEDELEHARIQILSSIGRENELETTQCTCSKCSNNGIQLKFDV